MRPTGPTRSERHARPRRWSRSTTSGPRSWRRTARSIRGPGWIGAGRGARRKAPDPLSRSRAAREARIALIRQLPRQEIPNRAQPRLRPANALVAAACEIGAGGEAAESGQNLARGLRGAVRAWIRADVR